MGSAFFVSHTSIIGLFIGGNIVSGYSAIISEGLLSIGRNMIFWWTVGLVPAIALPFTWYIIMLWYGGFWNDRQSLLYRRQRVWFSLVTGLLVMGLAGLAIGILLLAIPSQRLIELRVFIRWSIAGIPLMALAYSGYVLLCIILSLDALRRPGPSARIMGTLARQRARPWLVGASLSLLLVSLLVAGLLLWVVQDTRYMLLSEFYTQSADTIAVFDLLIASIIGLVIIMVGQAVVSYEVFTGKTLPRRGLLRHWQRSIILATGYSIVMGGAIAIALRPLYSLLLTTILMTIFFALFSWRSYVERERYFENLRPFLTSQRLYDQLLTQASPAEMDISLPFRALCVDVLDAQSAYVTAVGPLAPLVPPLVYGVETATPPDLSGIISQFNSPQNKPIQLDPSQVVGMVWGIPLWSERGLIGLFLLGPKRGNGLYTQEEIEIARVSGERLIDTQASAEMGRRLMGLQRERFAQDQVIDQRSRRILHDDILPTLHTVMLDLSKPANDPAKVLETLSTVHKQLSDLLHEMPHITTPELNRVGLVNGLQRIVADEFAHSFEDIRWEIPPGLNEQVSRIPRLTAEVIYYAAREAIRNASRHGRGNTAEDKKSSLCLNVSMAWRGGLEIVVEDNGVGVNKQTVTGGQGLALHSTMMAVIGGLLSVDSSPGKFTRITLYVPG